MNPKQNTQQPQNAPQKPATFHFRTWMILVPISCGIFLYILKNTDPVISWEKCMRAWGIENTKFFSQIFIIGVIAVVIVIIRKILIKK